MRIIKPSYEIWEQEEGLEGIHKQIERCGRVCYASDPIEGKAKDFVDRMINSGHGAMLEHGTVYLMLTNWYSLSSIRYIRNKYSKVIQNRMPEKYIDDLPLVRNYITTNYRVIMQGDYNTWEEAMINNYNKNWLEDLQYLCEPTEYHEKRVTVHFTTQIAITREANRHRVNSIAEQSTRYCDFGQEGKKFNEVGINLPSFVELKEDDIPDYDDFLVACKNIADGESYLWDTIQYWLFANQACEFSYQNLRRLGWLPQQARTVLPLDTNSQLIHTAFVSDWEHFFELRDDKKHAHPDIYILANPLHEEFKSKGWIK